jgi:hypothetical protein
VNISVGRLSNAGRGFCEVRSRIFPEAWVTDFANRFLGKMAPRTAKPPGGAALVSATLVCGTAAFVYIFTVRGSESLKLRVDSAGMTISLLPV